LQQAVRDEVRRLDSIDDPASQVIAVGDAFAAFDHELERIAEVRLDAIRTLRETGWSYDRIAAATGLSKGRAAQLSRDSRFESK